VWQNLFQRIDVLAPLNKLCLETVLEKLRTVKKLLLDSYCWIIEDSIEQLLWNNYRSCTREERMV
jgi:hypothetical protein